MNVLLKIDTIMFYVSNLEKAAKFYENELGLKRLWTDKEQGMIGFVFAGSDSEIVIHNDMSIHNPSFSFLVENVEEFCDEYQKKGYTVAQKPFDVRCGKFAVLSDPDGNELQIIDLTRSGDEPKYGE
jgi:lactoylglutathione lyase